MTLLVIAVVALIASALTFFSGFGLGTLLLPAIAFFLPVEQAIAATAIVHFLNSLFKVSLVGRHADRIIVLRFGVPAVVAAILGGWLLVHLAGIEPLATYTLSGVEHRVTLVKVVIGLLLLAFATLEVLPSLREMTFAAKYLPLGGLLSGFFGGLTGMQGALRAAFLARAGLSKEAFVATGAVISCLIDVTRLGVYAAALLAAGPGLDGSLIAVSVIAAFAGTLLGNRYLKKATMAGIQRLVSGLL